MKTSIFTAITLLLLSCTMLLQGCGKSTLVSSWLNEDKAGYHLEKVLVLAVFKDPVTQNIYEKSFVSLLQKAGVQAFPGSDYQLGPDEPSQAAIDSALSKSGAESILITHILSTTTDTYTVAPMVEYVSYFTYWDSVYGNYSNVHEQDFAPSETIEKRHERMAVTLFDKNGGKPVWSAISKSVNFEDRLRVDDEELEKIFIHDLRAKNLL